MNVQDVHNAAIARWAENVDAIRELKESLESTPDHSRTLQRLDRWIADVESRVKRLEALTGSLDDVWRRQ